MSAARPLLRPQQGAALLTVMVMLVIGVLIMLANARSGLLHEMIVGHQTDQARAFGAAEALLRDAEIDILGVHPDGRVCRESATTPGSAAPGFVGCRQRGSAALGQAPYFPQSDAEFDEVRAMLQVGSAVPCRDGICFPSSLQALAHMEDALETMSPHGARHGQFTRMGPASATGTDALPTQPTARAWYWVEAFRYETGADTAAPHRHLQPDPSRPFVYRITTVAHGLRPGTRAVIKSLFVPYPSEQLQ